MLANVSETWYTRLEQGREINASPDVLDAIARALRLDEHERAYLFMLAHNDDKAEVDETRLRPAIPRAIEALLDALEYVPAVIYGPRWDILAQNHAYIRVFGDIADAPIARGNVVRQVFLDPTRRRLFPDWESVARTLLQNFRVNAGRHAGDPDYEALIAGLRFESTEFARWWDEHDVVRRALGTKIIDHPSAGRIELEHAALALPDLPEAAMIAYTAPPGSRSERILRVLCTVH